MVFPAAKPKGNRHPLLLPTIHRLFQNEDNISHTPAAGLDCVSTCFSSEPFPLPINVKPHTAMGHCRHLGPGAAWGYSSEQCYRCEEERNGDGGVWTLHWVP